MWGIDRGSWKFLLPRHKEEGVYTGRDERRETAYGAKF